MKWISIPYIFVGTIILFSLIGYYVDKKFDIGNYIILFILFGFFMGFYSSYRAYKRMTDDESKRKSN